MLFMNEYRMDIREKTAGMDRKQRFEYILTYYWYHMLGAAAALLLVIIFAGHFLFGEKPPLFACAVVNQVPDNARDGRIAKGFAESLGLPENRISIDSDYNFSYEGVRIEGVNESNFDKFFLKWGNSELDAVILEEDFYLYCKKMDGTFRNLDEFHTGTLPLYEDGAVHTAIVLEGQEFQSLRQAGGEKLLLVFPNNGKHAKECQQFIDYIGMGALHYGEQEE